MNNTKHSFTGYQVFMIVVLTMLQFTVILDFMVLSPLGDLLMSKLKIETSQFGLVVSAYAFSAAASGILAAGFADKFDRKKLLVFFYAGFMLGTLLCAVAPDYNFLLIARIVTGLFGGVISSVSYAIITDIFKLETRGRVMGFVQMAFSSSQALGIPLGLLLATAFDWHSPFWMITLFGTVLGGVIVIYMKPITGHLAVKKDHSPFRHLVKTVSNPDYLLAFGATTLLATGGFMLMPFGSAFSIRNLGLTQDQLYIVYGITGIFSSFFGPMIGWLSDKTGKFKIFCIGSLISMAIVAIFTRMGVTPMWLIIVINVCMFVGISARMISSSALVTAIPAMPDRGAFMSINSAVQQVSGGIAAVIAGFIVVRPAVGPVRHYPTLGYVVMCSMVISMLMMYLVDRYVQKKVQAAPRIPQPDATPAAVVEG